MSGRVEIIAGPERWWRWSEQEKLQLVAEPVVPAIRCGQIVRRRGINASQFFCMAPAGAGERADHLRPAR